MALGARTYAQLNSALSDLPATRDEGMAVPLWARASLAVAGAVGVLAAAAMAAMLFALVACLSAVWMVVSRAVTRRPRQAPLRRRGGELTRGRHRELTRDRRRELTRVSPFPAKRSGGAH